MLRTLQVSEEIHKLYTEGGKAEKAKLLKMFTDSGFDKAGFEMQIGFQSNLETKKTPTSFPITLGIIAFHAFLSKSSWPQEQSVGRCIIL